MFEVDEAAKVITGSCDPDANIIFGATVDPSFEESEIKITVVATGFDETQVSARSDASRSSSSFGRRVLAGGGTQQQSLTSTESSAAPKEQDDLDIPAFIRKKMM